jgi:hypothetical protein
LSEFTMHGFLSNLTATMLALHTVLGCCWHHGHRSAPASSLACCVEASDGCRGDRVPHASAATDSPGQSHDGRHECQLGTCTFLGPAKENPHESPLQIHALPAMPVLCGDVSVCDAGGWQTFCPRDALLPSLRLHLMHRVLLI